MTQPGLLDLPKRVKNPEGHPCPGYATVGPAVSFGAGHNERLTCETCGMVVAEWSTRDTPKE